MIRDVIAESWAQSPRQVVAAVLLTPLAVLAGWAVLVVLIVAGSPA
jgi:hypothetical protein